ncbi:hypothetical protein SKAU_G00250810 [Synaphobranchus kaupii]|uniref:Uncharacterized protein n=1 Tax=Synaphobranchus kaupii TaxID=118154 RepID=A0A9Q1F2Y0_SYNKA|nr:hypothetical protein SKAU_G00250810 [Synaphobranchus kaupii]
MNRMTDRLGERDREQGHASPSAISQPLPPPAGQRIRRHPQGQIRRCTCYTRVAVSGPASSVAGWRTDTHLAGTGGMMERRCPSPSHRPSRGKGQSPPPQIDLLETSGLATETIAQAAQADQPSAAFSASIRAKINTAARRHGDVDERVYVSDRGRDGSPQCSLSLLSSVTAE